MQLCAYQIKLENCKAGVIKQLEGVLKNQCDHWQNKNKIAAESSKNKQLVSKFAFPRNFEILTSFL